MQISIKQNFIEGLKILDITIKDRNKTFKDVLLINFIECIESYLIELISEIRQYIKSINNVTINTIVKSIKKQINEKQ